MLLCIPQEVKLVYRITVFYALPGVPCALAHRMRNYSLKGYRSKATESLVPGLPCGVDYLP